MVLPLSLALHASRISYRLKILMAGSIVLVAVRAYEATIWTRDAEYAGLVGVRHNEAGNAALASHIPLIDQ